MRHAAKESRKKKRLKCWLFLLVLIDTFFFPNGKSLGIRLSDFYADRIDGVVEFLLEFDPVLTNVFWNWHLVILESKLKLDFVAGIRFLYLEIDPTET